MVDEFCGEHDPGRTWACQDHDGGANAYEGCGVGCGPCLATTQSEVLFMDPVTRRGMRWLYPRQALGIQSRNGYGMVAPLADETQLVLQGTQYLLAVVADNLGGECLTGPNCLGFPLPDLAVGSRDCPKGVAFPSPGYMISCHAYTGSHWGPGPDINAPYCRLATETSPYGLVAIPSGIDGQALGAPSFFRLFPAGACHASYAVPCWADVVHNCGPDDPVASPYAGAWAALWAYFELDWEASFIPRPDATTEELAVIALKNAVMDFVSVWSPQMDRVDKVWGNSNLDVWRRTYDVECSQQPVVYQLPQSRLRNSGCAVDAFVHMHRASTTMTFTPLRWTESFLGSGGTPLQVKPYVRLLFEAELHVRCEFANGETACAVPVVQPDGSVTYSLVEFVSGGPQTSCQKDTLSPPLDTLILRDGFGRRMTVPPRVRWWGGLNDLTVESVPNIYSDDPSAHTIPGECCELLLNLRDLNGGRGMKITGMPSRFDDPHSPTGRVADHYGGQVYLGVPAGSWGFCV